MASSSATFSATQRAASPGAQALLNAVLSSSLEEEQRASHLQNLRHAEILACNSVAEIIESTCIGCVACKATLVKWRHHRSVGTLPPALRGEAPKCQFSADYAETDEAKAHQRASDDRFAAARTAQLDSDIAARTLEETFLLEAIKPEKAFLDMRAAVAPQAAAILARYKVPSTIMDPEGTPADCGVYAHRAIAIIAFNAGKREQIR
ncbi:hypothetical protein EDB84DRAFT_1571943 [Lactarius hengduanensis]|nr:hypothetical protein EDB84DRAFT_1571943 [Lactarius hengduanensis]